MTSRVEIRFQPGNRRSRVAVGTSLFTAAHWIGLAIDSTCGGRGTCGKCRVRVHERGVGISSADRHHLTAAELAQGWRLACRTAVVEDTLCTVPEVAEILRTAVTGVGRQVPVEPNVHKVYLELEPPSSLDPASDLERLRSALQAEGFGVQVDLGLLRELPATLRRAGFKITTVLVGQQLVEIEPGDTRGEAYGVAFDIGTTTIVGTLVDLTTGETRAVESAFNQQAVFGADVISRIAYTLPGEDRRREIQRAVVQTLNRILGRLSAAAQVDPNRVYEALVVGNSTMLHLLLGVEARPISVAPFVPAFRESIAQCAAELELGFHPRGRLETLPAIGAYVGADTLAGLHATGVARSEGPWLFVDIGTNSEIALGAGDRLLATSAPAGPAVEGSCIRAGMAASPGAIERVVLGRQLEIGVVGGGSGQGICGSGLIDSVAQLLRAGLLNSSGSLRSRSDAGDHPLAEHLVEHQGEKTFALTDSVRLTQRDIRELQSAKSSVATGVGVLMDQLGVGPADLDAVLLAGSFGSAIDPASARAIGLVPEVPLERIRFVGNVAAEGARMALLSFRERQVAWELARRVEYVELSARADFNDLFVDGLRFPERREVE